MAKNMTKAASREATAAKRQTSGVQAQLDAAKQARRNAEEAQSKAIAAAKQAERAAKEAARQAREQEGVVASRDVQLNALASYISNRDSPYRRVPVDLGCQGGGALASSLQTRGMAWALSPKPGAQPNWAYRNFGLINGLVATVEGAAIYGGGLYMSGENPPTLGEEAIREFGKGVYATGVYVLTGDLVSRGVAWYRSWKAKNAQGATQPAALP